MRTSFKTRAWTIGLAGALVAASTLATGTVSAETFRVAHSSNPGQSVYIYWDELAKKVNERAGGAIEMKVFPSGQLGGERADPALAEGGHGAPREHRLEQHEHRERRLFLGGPPLRVQVAGERADGLQRSGHRREHLDQDAGRCRDGGSSATSRWAAFDS